ncbi:uncharacterized protein [Antedon mediterranea]|uniref:uncharacterized protein n=1 Tax=Antedon mediterranea TaxID=105859 RepID=UPI003AF80F5E
MFIRKIYSFVSVLLLRLLLNTCQTAAQCTGNLSCMEDEYSSCRIIYKDEDGNYKYKTLTNDNQSELDVCYILFFKEETSQTCLETAEECDIRGGTIVSLDRNEYREIKDTVLDILSVNTESRFNAINKVNGKEHCVHVSILDKILFNDDNFYNKSDNESSDVNSIMCQQVISQPTTTFESPTSDDYTVEITASSSKKVTASSSRRVTSSSLEKNQQADIEVETISTSTIIIIVVAAVVVMLALIIFIIILRNKRKKYVNQRARSNIVMVQNESYSNVDVSNETNDIGINDDAYSVLNHGIPTADDDDYAYMADSIRVRINVDYEHMDDRSHDQPSIEVLDTYAYIGTDIIEDRYTDVYAGDYDKLDRTHQVVTTNYKNTYSTLEKDKEHYDTFQRVKDTKMNMPSFDNQYGKLEH